ncbi:GMC family oxidoreductase N-terminal domain-containing protein [Bradyrhizobium sp. Arg237L]|uniref:GMC family oxidoreductase n=1 Tax=Bradyrhizobium sp. Arg237L TaxID=3003352 RepID=UPI00249F04B1|nr:GMC family oxidoreductase N-terminal domain-containing protein [Bradyrhizobium sp. Arg237L]MDI4237114.1 GMC family oxidoreductase N-terminal domain-containing protein [Bradyrhizobium sp. Arg237L]
MNSKYRAEDIFDYVIVGAGAAGAVLANRLSADPAVTVCLIEAGGRNTSPWLHIPAGFIKVIKNPKWTWQFQAQTAGRMIAYPQGRTLGRTTAINGMIYNRGQAQDFDDWARMGNRGWSYQDVLPYFRRSENFSGPSSPQFHGRGGPLNVSAATWRHPICDAFIAAAAQSGIPENPDYNGAQQAGAGYFQRTIGSRFRSSTSNAFLRPISRRGNLSIRTHAVCSAVLFEGRVAQGVRYFVDGDCNRPVTIRARREVILSAGAINTPRLLEISGVGDAEHLARIGAPLVHHLPGVGGNLGDHYSVRVVARVRNSLTINEMTRGGRLLKEVLRWIAGRPNLLAVSPSIVHWFGFSRPGMDRADLQGVFTPASYREGAIGRLDGFPGMTAGVWAHRPLSRGHTHARSIDPNEAPEIVANYLVHPEDQSVLASGIRQARALLRHPALQNYFDDEVLPGGGVETDADILAFAGRYGMSAQHLSGTARMGLSANPLAVVDAELRVHGLDRLRVVDASVMPTGPSANTAAATMMIAEKAADMILGRPAAA